MSSKSVSKSKTRYSRNDREYIVKQIEGIKNDKDYVAIFEILTSDEDQYYTSNSNGIMLNFTTMPDHILDKVTKYLKKISQKRMKSIDTDVNIVPVSQEKNDRTYKLSNYEKNIIKQRNLKKVLNEDHDYEEMKMVDYKKKPVKKANKKAVNKKSRTKKSENKKSLDN